MKKSNVFLLKVIQGRIPEDLKNSKITQEDMYNLSTLIPQFMNNRESAVTQE